MYGKDVGKAFIEGGIAGGIGAVAGSISGFSQLPAPIQKVFAAAVTTSLQGKSPKEMDAATLQAAITAGLGAIANGLEANSKIRQELGRDATPEELNQFIWYANRDANFNNKVYDYMGGVKKDISLQNGFDTYTLDGVDYKIPAKDLETYAKNEGWGSWTDKQQATSLNITSPEDYRRLIDKTEEEKVIAMLQDKGIAPNAERVASIMNDWDFSLNNPSAGLSEAFEKSDKLSISNSRADSIQEAAALARSLGYSNFSYGGSDYKINISAPQANPYDFFVDKNEAIRAARADLGPGKAFAWTDPTTGETKQLNTYTSQEQAAVDQKRIDMMPAYGGSRNTMTGKPAGAENLFVGKDDGKVYEDTRVFDANGNVVSGSLSVADRSKTAAVAGALMADATSQLGSAGLGVAKALGLVDRGGKADNAMKDYVAFADSKVPAEVKAQSAEFAANMKSIMDDPSKNWTDVVGAVGKSVVNQPLMVAFNVASEIAQEVPLLGAAGLTKWAAKAFQAAPAIANRLGVGVDVVLNMMESGGAAANDAYTRSINSTKDAVKNGSMTQDQADALAESASAKALGLASTVTGGLLLVPGGNALTKQIFKDSGANDAVNNAFKTVVKTTGKEAVSEGAEASTIEAITQKLIDPDGSLNWKAIAGTGAMDALIGSKTAGSISAADVGVDALSSRLADNGVSQTDIDAMKKSIDDSVKSGGANITASKTQIADQLQEFGYTPDAANRIADQLTDSVASNSISSFLETTGIDASKIPELTGQIYTSLQNSPDASASSTSIQSILTNAGIDSTLANTSVGSFLGATTGGTTTGGTTTTTGATTTGGGATTGGTTTGTTGTTGTTTGTTTPASLTKTEVETIINTALAANPSLTTEQVTRIVTDAIGALPVAPTLTDINTAISTALTAAQEAQAAKEAEAEKKRLEEEAKRKADEADAARQASVNKAVADEKAVRQAQLTRGMAGMESFGPSGVGAAIAPLVPSLLTSKEMKPQFQDPLAEFQKLTAEPYAGENQFPGLAPQISQDQPMPQENSFYSYGQSQSLDDIFGQGAQNQPSWDQNYINPLDAMTGSYASGGLAGTRYGQYAGGGMATPLMAAGGKLRVDFRHGDAVTGPGDGQSDDIPAMLADGEFVFPADVVAALGNGSTKAGSDKLYEMMHGIRAHVRSAHPKDLPPEINSPLDFLKTKPRKARR